MVDAPVDPANYQNMPKTVRKTALNLIDKDSVGVPIWIRFIQVGLDKQGREFFVMKPYSLFAVAIAASAVSTPVGSQSEQNTAVTLALPIACELGRTCEIQNYVDRDKGPAATDYLCGSVSYNDHSGVDFRILDMVAQRRGVSVLAAASGKVTAIRDGVADVSVRDIDRATIAGRECGNGVVIDHGGGLTTQYCHMAKGSIAVASGMQVSSGAVLGRVGLSGNSEYPHLHFTVRRANQVIDPFAPSAGSGRTCGSGQSMWQERLSGALTYKAGVVLNSGFATAGLTMAAVEAGGIAPPTIHAPAIVAYVRAINLKIGDVQQFTLRGPNGAVLASHTGTPMTSNQAQRFVFIGKNRPATGWPTGRYTGEYAVLRSGRAIMHRSFSITL
jgi:hypothetical protein